MGFVIGLAGAIGLELLDTTIKSGGEMKIKVKKPLLGVIPRLPVGENIFNSRETALIESMKMTTRKIRHAAQNKGVRFLIASSTHGEGNTWVAANLAASFSRQGERVLIIDAQVRMREDSRSLRELVMQAEELDDDGMVLPGDVEAAIIEWVRKIIAPFRRRLPEFAKPPLRLARAIIKRAIALASSPTAFMAEKLRQVWQARKRKRWADTQGFASLILDDRPNLKGLGGYLSFEASSLNEVIWKTRLEGVECIPQAGEPVTAESLGSKRMRELLEQASEEFDVVLIDSPPILPYVDAEVLSENCDAIIFVAQSRLCTASTLKKALSRFETTSMPVAGTILNGVDSLYMERE